MVILCEKDRFEFTNIRVSTKMSLEFLSCSIKTKFGVKARRVDTLATKVILGDEQIGTGNERLL